MPAQEEGSASPEDKSAISWCWVGLCSGGCSPLPDPSGEGRGATQNPLRGKTSISGNSLPAGWLPACLLQAGWDGEGRALVLSPQDGAHYTVFMGPFFYRLCVCGELWGRGGAWGQPTPPRKSPCGFYTVFYSDVCLCLYKMSGTV